MVSKERCEVCGSTEDLHVDHGHDHGYIRGILCSGCNKAEGFLRGNPELARALASYMEKPHTGILWADHMREYDAARQRQYRKTANGQKHQAKFVARRSERYRTDPEYREQVQARNRERYHTDPIYREAVKARNRAYQRRLQEGTHLL